MLDRMSEYMPEKECEIERMQAQPGNTRAGTPWRAPRQVGHARARTIICKKNVRRYAK